MWPQWVSLHFAYTNWQLVSCNSKAVGGSPVTQIIKRNSRSKFNLGGLITYKWRRSQMFWWCLTPGKPLTCRLEHSEGVQGFGAPCSGEALCSLVIDWLRTFVLINHIISARNAEAWTWLLPGKANGITARCAGHKKLCVYVMIDLVPGSHCGVIFIRRHLTERPSSQRHANGPGP